MEAGQQQGDAEPNHGNPVYSYTDFLVKSEYGIKVENEKKADEPSLDLSRLQQSHPASFNPYFLGQRLPDHGGQHGDDSGPLDLNTRADHGDDEGQEQAQQAAMGGTGYNEMLSPAQEAQIGRAHV